MTTEPAPRRYLTVAEVAAEMRVSAMTVYRIIRAGDLPAIRVGRSFRIPQEALVTYLREHVVEPDGASVDPAGDQQVG